MKSDPAAFALFDVLDECGLGRVGPVVGRVVQLDEEIVFCEKCVVDLLSVFDVVDREIVLAGQFSQPDLCGVHKWLVDAAVLGEGKHAESDGLVLRLRAVIYRAKQQSQCKESPKRPEIQISTASKHISECAPLLA